MTSWKDEKVVSVVQKFDTPYVREIVLILDEPAPDVLRQLNTLARRLPVAVKLIVNEKRMGVGFGIRQGLRYCQANGYKFVVLMAANGKDDPSEIPRLTRALSRGFEYVQGSRFMRGGRGERTPFPRGIFVRLWPEIWTLLVGRRLTEVTNGFRAYTMHLLHDNRIHLDQPWLDHYALEYYLHYKALTCGYRYCEVPVTKTYAWPHNGKYSKIVPYKDWKDVLLPPLLLRFGIRS